MRMASMRSRSLGPAPATRPCPQRSRRPCSVRELEWNGEFYIFFIQLSSDLRENFQLVVDMDWDRIFHPSVADANSSVDYETMGPSFGDGRTRGLNWTVGIEGHEKVGDIFEVNVYVDQVRRKVIKVD